MLCLIFYHFIRPSTSVRDTKDKVNIIQLGNVDILMFFHVPILIIFGTFIGVFPIFYTNSPPVTATLVLGLLINKNNQKGYCLQIKKRSDNAERRSNSKYSQAFFFVVFTLFQS